MDDLSTSPSLLITRLQEKTHFAIGLGAFYATFSPQRRYQGVCGGLPMRSALSTLPSAATSAQVGEILSVPSMPNSGGWQDIVNKVSSYLSTPQTKTASPSGALNHLTGLLRLQMDVTRYQLRIEVVSKVAESAVASLRRLQQSQ